MNLIWRCGQAALAVAVISITGCAMDTAHQKPIAVDSMSAGVTRAYATSAIIASRVVEATLASEGFKIESSDASTGVVQAERDDQDPNNASLSRHIVATVHITATGADGRTDVTLAARQQTGSQRDWHRVGNLKWSLPSFSNGADEAEVSKESEVTDVAFYEELFSEIDRGVTSAKTAPTSAVPEASTTATAAQSEISAPPSAVTQPPAATPPPAKHNGFTVTMGPPTP